MPRTRRKALGGGVKAPAAPSLQVPPRADALNVSRLLQDALQGSLRIPEFQRKLKWKPEDARSLIDSIYRGYPIGTLLFWQTAAEEQQLRLGTHEITASSRDDALYVVDGQQRVYSLVRTLVPPKGEEPFSLEFDLDADAVVRARSARADDHARFLPLSEVEDAVRLQLWLTRHGVGHETERFRRALQVGRRIREFNIPSYIVRTDDDSALRVIFERVNNSGHPLAAHDVFHALHAFRSMSRPRSLSDIDERVHENLRFGLLGEETVYRTLQAVRGDDPGRGRVPRLDAASADQAFQRTEEALSATVAFLKTDAGIPHISLLPYSQPILVLGRFFALFPKPLPRSRELLSRWFWREAAGASGASGSSIVGTRERLAVLRDDEEESVQRLLALASSSPQAEWQLGKFNTRTAKTRIELVTLWESRPRSLDGGPVGFSAEAPARLFNSQSPVARTVASRILVHASPSEIRTWIQRASPDDLHSHLIDEDAREALSSGNTDAFLSRRAGTIRRAVHELLLRRARWGAIDRPSIESLRVPD